jgi:hypothetical protein
MCVAGGVRSACELMAGVRVAVQWLHAACSDAALVYANSWKGEEGQGTCSGCNADAFQK